MLQQNLSMLKSNSSGRNLEVSLTENSSCLDLRESMLKPHAFAGDPYYLLEDEGISFDTFVIKLERALNMHSNIKKK